MLLLVTAFTICALFAWHIFLPESAAKSRFTLWCVITFVVINILAYYSGLRAATSKSNYRFIQLMMILILVKMFVCIGLVVAYVKISSPDSKLFVLPFLTIYLIYTIFEIFVLQKIARYKAEPSESHER
jgi:hypothetical protein